MIMMRNSDNILGIGNKKKTNKDTIECGKKSTGRKKMKIVVAIKRLMHSAGLNLRGETPTDFLIIYYSSLTGFLFYFEQRKNL